MEQVKLTTYDGVELVANLYLPTKEEGQHEWSSGIIVCHGFGSKKENYSDFGELAANNGFAALVLDLRGHGESGGEVDSNIFNDIAAALQYMQSCPEVNPTSIAIQGSSLGGWLAIHTAAHLKDVSPIIAYAPPNESLLTILMEEVALVQRGHTSPMVPANPPRVNVNSMIQLLYRLDVAKSARRLYPRPLLLIHCEGDEEVPSIFSERIYAAMEEPKSMWLIPGGNHRFAQHDPETNQRVLDWLELTRPATEKLTLDTLPDD